MASIFFGKIHLKQSNFEYRKIQSKRKLLLTNKCSQLDSNRSFIHGLNAMLENPCWYNPIWKEGKIQYEKKRILKNIYLQLDPPKKLSSQQSAPSSAHCRAPAPSECITQNFVPRTLGANLNLELLTCCRVCDLSLAATHGREDLASASQTVLANLLAAQHARGHCVPPRTAYGSRLLHVLAQCARGT